MSMLSSFDPFFRDFSRLADQTLGRRSMAPAAMSADAFRHGDEFVVRFDMPGVEPDSVDLTVERNVLSVTAERHWAPETDDQIILAERPQGRFSRQLYLSDHLDTDRITASYEQGVLTVRIPVSEQAKPRKVQIGGGSEQQSIEANAR